ncbi:MAG: hypothetical protein ABII02_04485 [Candidatus Magasanikbacteria bacterium]
MLRGKENKKYDDDFGYHPIWNAEINKWLEFVYGLNKNFYDTGKTDIAKPEKRDAFLGEIKAVYFCHKFLKGKQFKLEPNTEIDFEYEKSGVKIFVEVKSPSWHGEIFKDDSLTIEQKKKRKGSPQYINGEGRSFSPRDAIEDSIKNSLHKFKKNKKNILMITPNMFVGLHNSHNWRVQKIINEELQKQDVKNLITKVAILETELPAGDSEIKYIYSEYQRKI